MYKIIITYELIFIVFWNLLYLSNSDIENWFTEKFLTAIFVFLSTMALGATIVYIIYISAKLSGFIDKLKKIKDPRKNTQ
tara:strand:+ start:259 stop:498 length:240 start_codon:yes stop_codon:yes gene_type:complete